MGLNKLMILVEKAGSTDKDLQFDSPSSGSTIVAMFNPAKLTVSRSVSFGPTAHSFRLSFKGVKSQSFTVLSKLAEASCFPSGLNATRLTTLI